MAKNLITEAAREFIAEAVKVSGGNAAALAKKAKVSPTTITRPINDANYSFTPKLHTLMKIAEAAGLPLPAVFRPSNPASVSQWRTVQVVGEVREGAYLKTTMHSREVDDQVYVKLYDYDPTLLSAFRITDGSAAPYYMENSVVIVAPVEAVGIRLDDHLIVERYSRALVETTVKALQVDPEGRLSFASVLEGIFSNEDFEDLQEGTILAEGKERYTIRGVIIGSYREARNGKGPLVMLPSLPEGLLIPT